MTTPEQDALAKRRFMALNLIRLSGAALVLLGLACAFDKVAIPQPPRHALALLFIPLGLFDFFFVPNMFARRWRTPGG